MRRTPAEKGHVSCISDELDVSLAFSNHPVTAAGYRTGKQTPPSAGDENSSRLFWFVSVIFDLSSGSASQRALGAAKSAAHLSLDRLFVASNNKRLSPRAVTSGLTLPGGDGDKCRLLFMLLSLRCCFWILCSIYALRVKQAAVCAAVFSARSAPSTQPWM